MWTYNISMKDFVYVMDMNFADLEAGYNATGVIKLTQNYKSGLPEGGWAYLSNLKGRSVKNISGKIFWKLGTSHK